MNVAILIIAHKKAAVALLESAEMICGKQNNVKAVSFLENEDGAALKEKCILAMSKLDMQDGGLILTDLFGGTPFNTAYMLCAENEKVEVLSGLSLPMLMEVFMSRDSMDVKQLLEQAKIAGIEGIQSARYKDLGELDE